MIGVLTETIGNPAPISIPFVARRQVPDSSLRRPVEPQAVWRFRQSVEYSMTANYAVLDFASRQRESLLQRIYRMGRDQIQWGSEPHWTQTPRRLERAREALQARGEPVNGDTLRAELRRPDLRDPRGYILPADQPDFGTVVKFANALIHAGVVVHRATAPFTIGAVRYPAGSIVVKTAQAFRPHVLDMFEPQEHPDDFPVPGGAPTPPYDSAGWTLAYQMGIEFDRVLDAFDGPFERVTDLLRVPQGMVLGGAAPAGYLFTPRANDSYRAVNRLLAAGVPVIRVADGPLGPGAFYVSARSDAATRIAAATAADLGISFTAAGPPPAGSKAIRRPPRIGLFDQYGGHIPSGWARLVLEQFEFPYEVVYPPALDAGRLRERYDVLVFNDGGLAPALPPPARAPAFDPPLPDDLARRVGAVTADTVERLREFLRDGGSFVAIGSAASGAVSQFGLPLSSHLVETGPDGTARPLPRESYYVPGSVLRVAVDTSHPAAHGLPPAVDVFFDDSPVFRLDAGAAAQGARVVAWFDSVAPLRSGWAWGQHHLHGGAAVVDVPAGAGRVLLVGPEILFRAQSHGTFKFLFNALLTNVDR
jgi:hypothetical protein